jgi:Tol biopolymer transport system component
VRDPALSPDGRTLYFSWRGDLWTAPTAGGAARRLTAHPARDLTPRVSPDGRELAFVSDRTGSMQVFTMPAAGGAPRQVTLHTEGYRLLEWAPDGSGFLVSATRDHWWRRSERLFLQPRDGARAPQLLFDDYGSDGTLSQGGNVCLFTREGPPVWRKGYRGSQEGQVWVLHRDRGVLGRLHEGDASCRWPLWAPDGQTHYYVSGPNLVRAGMVTDERTELTRYTDDGVLFPAISRDGSTIVYLHQFDLWRLDPATAESKKIELFDAGDPTLEVERRTTLDRATDAAFTEDGREVAFAAGGDIWVMDTELREPVAVTRTPEEERDPVFTPDHKTLVFVSDQGGQSDLYAATRADEKQ